MGAGRSCAASPQTAGPALKLRPYQLLCLICSAEGDDPGILGEKLKRVRDAIRENPDVPITLVCNAGDVYCYQDPGTEDDTPEGTDYNRKRDLDMLQKLGLGIGSTMKARDLFRLIFERIPTTKDICGRENAMPSVWWDGCGESNRSKGNENYEKGRKELMEKLKQG